MHKLAFQYDYLGRRVEKTVYNWSGGAWQAADVRRFVYHGWLLLMELDANNQPVRKYTWGLDLAGQMGGAGVPPANLEAAGGIGGLLAVQDTNGTPSDPNDDLNYVYCYEGNGNVGQLLNLFYNDPNDPNGGERDSHLS